MPPSRGPRAGLGAPHPVHARKLDVHQDRVGDGVCAPARPLSPSAGLERPVPRNPRRRAPASGSSRCPRRSGSAARPRLPLPVAAASSHRWHELDECCGRARPLRQVGRSGRPAAPVLRGHRLRREHDDRDRRLRVGAQPSMTANPSTPGIRRSTSTTAGCSRRDERNALLAAVGAEDRVARGLEYRLDQCDGHAGRRR